jgi:hypothetical protein
MTALLAAAANSTLALAAPVFQIVSSPNPAGSNFNEFDGVASVSSSDAWAVRFTRGGDGPFRALVERWNGKTWSLASSAARPAADDTRLHAREW